MSIIFQNRKEKQMPGYLNWVLMRSVGGFTINQTSCQVILK